jgi:outer membrane protein assembly factor BamB
VARGLAAAPSAPGASCGGACSGRGSVPRLLTVFALLTVLGAAPVPRAMAADDDDPAAAEVRIIDETAWDQMTPGVPLQPDRALRRLLAEADEFAAEGRYEEAVELWQRALDYAGRTMTVPDPVVFRALLPGATDSAPPQYQVFRPVRHEIEARIRELPEDALRLYRLRADGEARGLINAATDRSAADGVESARRAVVRRYFLSDVGDDSAWRLAARSFDRADFVNAQRLLRRLKDHPDADVPREWVLLRMAVAGDQLGNERDAEEAWREFETLGGGGVPAAVRRAVERQLADGRRETPSARSRGTIQPVGLVRSAADPSGAPVTLTEGWVVPFDRRMTESDPGSVTAGTVSITAVNGSAIGQPTRQELIERWSEHGWVPANDPLIRDGRIYYYGVEHVTCCAAADGRLLWRSTHGNEYELDSLSRTYALTRAEDSPVRPTTFAGVRLFGDRVHPQLTLADGLLYCLEGRVLDYGSHSIGTLSPTAGITGQRRCRENRLTAYDAQTGKLRWSRSAGGNDIGPADGAAAGAASGTAAGGQPAGFLGAPFAHQGRLYAVVTHNGELRVLCLDATTGETLWDEFLCDEPFTGASPWAPVGITADGDDVYVAPGTGLVFALDARGGALHWATRYDRNGIRQEPDPGQFRAITTVSAELDGWQADTLVAHGRCLVVLPSDACRLFALDRTDGTLLWDSPRWWDRNDTTFVDLPKVDRVLGTAGDGLFVAGPHVVRRYKMSSGRIVWEAPLENSCGVGTVGDGVLVVPDGRGIVQLDPDTGRELARADFLTTTDEPVGNLKIADGRLFVAGCERVFALTPLSRRMMELAGAVEGGDDEACLTRMRLNARRAEYEAAVDDLRRAYEIRRTRDGVEPARAMLVAGLSELSIPDSRPLLTIAWLTDDATASIAEPTRQTERTQSSLVDEFAASEDDRLPARRSAVLYSVLNSLRGGLRTAAADTDPADVAARTARDREAVRLLLEGGPLWRQDELEEQAARTVAALASAADVPVLLEALKSSDATTRLLAVEGLAHFAESHADRLAAAVADPSDAVRYRAAVAQLNLGRREALGVLAELLQSEELPIRSRAAAALRSARGDGFGFAAYDSPDERREAADRWTAWAAGDGRTAELRLPVSARPMPVGRILVTNARTQQVCEINAANIEGEPLWQRDNMQSVWSARSAPDGRRVVTATNPRCVTVYDADGDTEWQVKDLPGTPFSAQLLENGNLLIACNSRNVLEYRRGDDGTTLPEPVETWSVPGVPQWVERLENGHTLVAISNPGQVIQYDRQWNPVRQLTGLGNPVSVQRLPNGHILVADSQTRTVNEYGPEGQRLVWSHPWQRARLYSAQRTPDGLTLIADDQGLALVNLNHEITAERRDSGLRSAEAY